MGTRYLRELSVIDPTPTSKKPALAVLPCAAAWSMGLVAIRRGMGSCRDWQPAGTEAGQWGANPVGRDLRGDGLGGSGRLDPATTCAGIGGFCLGGGGRTPLHHRYRFLRA